MYDDLVKTLTNVVKTHWNSEKDMDAFILAYNKSSAYASDDVVRACKEFFNLLINKEKDDDGKITKSIDEIYNAIRKDINPRAKSFEFQLYTVGPTLQQQSQPES